MEYKLSDTAPSPETTPSPDSVFSGLLKMPEVQEHAVEAARSAREPGPEETTQEAGPSSAPSSDLFDKAGNRFNPEIHATGNDGRGKKTASGNWAKKRGRKAGSLKIPGDKSAETRAIELEARKKAESAALGQVAANLVFTLGVGLGGDEWRPEIDPTTGKDEPAHMTTAFGDYFHAKNMQDIPPGVALVLAVAMYAAPRFAKPKTQTRVGNFAKRMKKFYTYIRGKSADKKDRK